MDELVFTTDLDFTPYFNNQVASGLSNGFAGDRYHVGNGRWGKILETLKPAWEYIKKFGWTGAKEFGKEIMKGKNLSDAGAQALITTSEQILEDANERLESYKNKRMTGSGVKRKTSSKKHTKRKKIKKSKKRITKKSKRTKKVYKRKAKSKKRVKIVNYI